MNRRSFLKSLALLLPFAWHRGNGSYRWGQQDDLSIEELEVLAEEVGGEWLKKYLILLEE